ncbi:MAG: hypothetical protein EA361_17020 [Bacteroidetes bacterium]|nr:MAG: hypothetical protein EA361_17020 [Bacteroidota bacterium]
MVFIRQNKLFLFFVGFGCEVGLQGDILCQQAKVAGVGCYARVQSSKSSRKALVLFLINTVC